MGEQQQNKKRLRSSANAEGSGGKKSSVVALSCSPVATVPPSAPAAPSPVAMAKPAPTAAVTSPLAAMPLAPAAPSPAATTEGDMTTPAATVVVTSPVAAMAPAPAAPSSAAIAKSAAMVVDLEATSPVAIVKPVRVVKPEDEVAEQEDAAMAAVAAEEVEAVSLTLPKKLFHCAACLAPLKPPVFRCENEHFVCHACGGDGGANKHCVPCGRDVDYTRSRFMDGVVDAYKVPCLYKGFGCTRSMAYHSAADHKARCKHAPCYCFECRFVGSPAKLVRHLASLSGEHAWSVEKIKYEVAQPFVVPASSEDQRRLLVAEDDRVFLLAVGAGRDPGGRRPVTVVCVRGNADADADARPLYTGVLWVEGPPASSRQPLSSSFKLQATVASCSVPGAVDMEQGWLHAHVNPNMLHGESGELHLRLCLTKFP